MLYIKTRGHEYREGFRALIVEASNDLLAELRSRLVLCSSSAIMGHERGL